MYDVHVCLKSMENFMLNWSLMSSNTCIMKSKSEKLLQAV